MSRNHRLLSKFLPYELLSLKNRSDSHVQSSERRLKTDEGVLPNGPNFTKQIMCYNGKQCINERVQVSCNYQFRKTIYARPRYCLAGSTCNAAQRCGMLLPKLLFRLAEGVARTSYSFAPWSTSFAILPSTGNPISRNVWRIPSSWNATNFLLSIV